MLLKIERLMIRAHKLKDIAGEDFKDEKMKTWTATIYIPLPKHSKSRRRRSGQPPAVVEISRTWPILRAAQCPKVEGGQR